VSVTRRRLVGAAAAATGVAAATAVGGSRLLGGDDGARAGVATRPRGALPRVVRPSRQHGWNASLDRDRAGNVLPPRHQRLLLCELVDDPTPDAAWRAEAALRHVERRTGGDHRGLLIAIGWGPAWFRRIGVRSPVPAAVALNDAEVPRLDDPVCVLHVGSDDPEILDRAEREWFGRGGDVDPAAAGGGGTAGAGAGHPAAGDDGAHGTLGHLLRVTERRTGFVGDGLPEEHRTGTAGLPQDRPLPEGAPMFMGFQSGLRRNQASEDDVTIASGRWAGGTTMHVSSIALALDSWYRSLDDRGRVQRMFGATTTPRDVARRRRGIRFDADADLAAVQRRHGVVGHAEAAATARRDGDPVILRRDFNSVDRGGARVHFVALQASIDDFVATRRAMDARRAVGGVVGVHVNNGITEWMTVESRANLLVPSRADRICPGLRGWSA